MSDIVKRLRFGYLPTPIGNKNANDDALEAANEIERLRGDLKTLHDEVFKGLKELDFRYPPSSPHITEVRLNPDHTGKNKALGLIQLRRGFWAVSAKYPEFCEEPIAPREPSPKGLCPGGCGMPSHVCVCDGGDRATVTLGDETVELDVLNLTPAVCNERCPNFRPCEHLPATGHCNDIVISVYRDAECLKTKAYKASGKITEDWPQCPTCNEAAQSRGPGEFYFCPKGHQWNPAPPTEDEGTGQ